MTGKQSMSTSLSQDQAGRIPALPESPVLRCPACRQEPPRSSPDAGSPCPACGFELTYVDGILRALPQARQLHFRRFMAEYEEVRAKEGRGSRVPEYYLALPFSDLNRANDWQWRIRSRTYRHFAQHVLGAIENSHPGGCDVLDLGAGNCWLSYRLAQRGHRPVALDLLVNPFDGLGAGRHYLPQLQHPFVRVQGEMDNLPFASGQFDIAIFNASLHYSANYERTLQEVVRCLRHPGYVVIADTPFYSNEQDGQRMLAEKQSTFLQKFGISPGDMQSREYLTPDALSQLAHALHLRWSIHRPWYGVGWMLRPVKASLLKRRKPSKFYLLVAETAAQES